jgi:Cdc6-like AAA superfamily ATPase
MSEMAEKVIQIMQQMGGFTTTYFESFAEDPKAGFMKIMLWTLGLLLVVVLVRTMNLVTEFFKNRQLEKKGVLLEILVKRTTSAKNTEALIRNLHSTLLNTNMRALFHGRPYLSFEIVAEKDKITFYTWGPRDYRDMLTERIYATYPECAIREVNDYLPKRLWTVPIDYVRYFKQLLTKQNAKWPKYHESVYGTEMELGFHHVLPLNKNLDREDIISSIVSTMKNLEWHEKLVLQVLARPVDGSWQRDGQKVLKAYVADGIRPNKKGGKPGVFDGIGDDLRKMFESELSEFNLSTESAARGSRKTPYERKEITGATEKILDAGFETVIRLAAIGNFRKSAKTRLKALGSAFNELNKENKLARNMVYAKQLFYRRLKNRRVYLVDKKNIFTPGELSKFFLRLPDETLIDQYPEIQALVIKEFAPPRGIESDKIKIGLNQFRGSETTIGIKYKDMKRHIIVQGKTGTGKSEWAKGLMKNVMDLGLGFALFEPHGKLADETLRLVPAHRRKDVIVFDLFGDYPTPFNFCRIKEIKGRRTEEIVEKTAKEIIDINRRLFSEAWSGKNAYYLENAIKTVIELKGGNYVDIRRLFTDAKFRKYAIENIKDPQLIHFWKSEFAVDKKGNLSPGTQSTVNSVDYKLGSFLNSKSLLRCVGQDDCIDFKEILDQNKILIFRFDKERMSEDQLAFIGGIASKMLIVEAFRRDKAQWDNPYLLIMDEFQNFLTPSIETILDELRKYGVCLVAMHQRLKQLDKIDGLKNAIYNNVGTKITFTAGDEDAKELSRYFEPRVDDKDLMRLPSRYGYVKLLVDGQTSETFNLYTLDSPRVSEEEAAETLKEIQAVNREGKLYYKDIDKMIASRLVGDIEEVTEDHFEVVEQDDDDQAWPQEIDPDIDRDQDLNNLPADEDIPAAAYDRAANDFEDDFAPAPQPKEAKAAQNKPSVSWWSEDEQNE